MIGAIGKLGSLIVKVVADEYDVDGWPIGRVGCAGCAMHANGECSSAFSQHDEREEFGNDCILGDWHYEEV